MKKNLKHYLNPLLWIEKWNLSTEERKRREAEEEAERVRDEAAEKINIRLVKRDNGEGEYSIFYALLLDGVIVFTSREPDSDLINKQQDLREAYLEAYLGKSIKLF